MNKALKYMFALVLVLPLLFTTAHAAEIIASGDCGEYLSWSLSDAGELTISGEGAMENYSSTLDQPWYSNRERINILTINNGVTTIGDYAFNGCKNISGTLLLPESIITIGNRAFTNCDGFTGDLVFPDSISNIGESAFSGCNGFNGKIKLPEGITEIKENTFNGCNNITGPIEMPETLLKIGKRGFGDCINLRGELCLPNNLEIIGDSAFIFCGGLTGSLVIPDSVKAIGEDAFYFCSGLDGSLTLPKSLTEIKDAAFAGCRSLKGDLKIPDGVTTIGSSAFCECEGFDGRLTIPDSVKTIENYAFSWCGFTGSLELPSNLMKIGYYAFERCGGFTGIVEIPASVKTIGSQAFKECNGLVCLSFKGDAPEILESEAGYPHDSLALSTNLPVFYLNTADGWSADYGENTCYIWDGEIRNTSISLDLIEGSIEIFSFDEVQYYLQNGIAYASAKNAIVRQSNNQTSTTNTIEVSRGACAITISGLNISADYNESPIMINPSSSLALTLVGNNTILADNSDGICVPEQATLLLDGSGSLTITVAGSGAAIGGGDTATGIITINNGTITANGGDYSAGIGGGRRADGGEITINDGMVIANGGRFGAGIGGGDEGAAGNININGGIIIASNGASGAAIGTGDNGDGGLINICGGNITANNSSQYGVGAGRNGTVDEVIIFSGTLVTKSISANAVTISNDATVTQSVGGGLPKITETIYIDTQPMTSAALMNNTPVLFVDARGNSGLSYQWQVSADNVTWIDLDDEIAAALARTIMTKELDGNYARCKITNGWGNVEYTDIIQLWVLAFSKQPLNVEANLDDVVSFDTTSICVNVTYQWQRSFDEGTTWIDVSGESYPTLVLNATLSENSALYRCVITATNGDKLASDNVRVIIDAGAVTTYAVQYYLQSLDGNSYSLVLQQIKEGVSGETAIADTASYTGFTENEALSSPSGIITGDNGLVLTRYYDRDTYAIALELNGGSGEAMVEALYGAEIEQPSNPSRYGYTFAGWYADAELTTRYTFTTMPLNGDTIYAAWEPVGGNRGIEYKINSLGIRDANSFELLDEIPKGNFLVEVNITNLCATATDTIMLVHYSTEGRMLGMHYLFANPQIGQALTFGVLVENSDGNVGKVKVFVLPTLGNPTPLAESLDITN